MQQIVKTFLERALRHFSPRGPIVEIGSYQVAGQEGFADLRPYFNGMDYIGVDMRKGLGVDRIENVENMNFPDNSVETILSFDTFEHIAHPFKAIDEIYRVLKDNGYLFLSVPFHFQIHDYPSDYWRYTPNGVGVLLEKFDYKVILWERTPSDVNPVEVYAVAVKNPESVDGLGHSFRQEASLYYGILP